MSNISIITGDGWFIQDTVQVQLRRNGPARGSEGRRKVVDIRFRRSVAHR